MVKEMEWAVLLCWGYEVIVKLSRESFFPLRIKNDYFLLWLNNKFFYMQGFASVGKAS